MKEKIFKILLLIFAVMASIYPVLFGIYKIKGLLIVISLILILMSLAKYIDKYKSGYIIAIVLLGIITRVGVVLFCNSHIVQISDFGKALNASFSLDFSEDYYRYFSHWILYPTIVHGIYYLFGSHQLVALLTNAVINILSAIMIYKTGTLIFDNKKYSFLASLIYLFWPGSILYTVIFTQEHLNALIIITIVYLFLKINNPKTNDSYFIKYIYPILIGILLAVTCFLKNFSPAFLISFIILLFLWLIKNKFDKILFFKKIVCLSLIILSFIFFKQLLFVCVDNLVGKSVTRNITPCYLNVGLRDNGVYNVENYAYYYNLVKENNFDFEKANKEAMSGLFSYIDSKGLNYYLVLLKSKGNIILNNDEAKISWFSLSIKDADEYSLLDNLEDIKFTNNLYYSIIMLLVGISLLETIKFKNLKTFFLQLLYFGACLMLLLVEAQNRYTYSMQVILCILSVVGIKILIDFLKTKFRGDYK